MTSIKVGLDKFPPLTSHTCDNENGFFRISIRYNAIPVFSGISRECVADCRRITISTIRISNGKHIFYFQTCVLAIIGGGVVIILNKSIKMHYPDI